MLTNALLTLLVALVTLASGRLILAFLPPGWPGCAPGMGTRELGATVGVSWLVGSLAHTALAVLTDLMMLPVEQAEWRTVHDRFAAIYLGVHLVLAVALLLRSPAKLRPRHEAPAPRRDWLALLLALATFSVAGWITFRGELAEIDSGGARALERVARASLLLVVVGPTLGIVSLVLLLVGALGQLGIRRWVAWSVGLASLLSYLELTEDPFRHLYGNWVPPLYPAMIVLVACVTGLVWAHRADRRARNIALLLISSLPLTAGADVVPAATLGLCFVLFALPAGTRRPVWPWVALLVTAPAQLALQYRFFSHQYSQHEYVPAFQPHSFALPAFDAWRLWLAPIVGVLIACWYLSRHSRVKDQPLVARRSWWLVALVPVLLALTAWSDGSVILDFEGNWMSAQGRSAWHFSLPYLALGWTPALLVLLAVHFGPRETHATTVPLDPS